MGDAREVPPCRQTHPFAAVDGAPFDALRAELSAEKAARERSEALLARIVHQVYLMSLRGIGDGELGGLMAEARAIVARKGESNG